jgi:hypothetical protein
LQFNTVTWINILLLIKILKYKKEMLVIKQKLFPWASCRGEHISNWMALSEVTKDVNLTILQNCTYGLMLTLVLKHVAFIITRIVDIIHRQ